MLKTATADLVKNEYAQLNAKVNVKSAEETMIDLSKLGSITDKKLYDTFTKRNQSQDAMSQKKVQFQSDNVNFIVPHSGQQ